MSKLDGIGGHFEGIAGAGNGTSELIREKETGIIELFQLSNSSEKGGNIFDGLSRMNEDGSITFSENHPILDGHFGNENGIDVQIVPGVYLRSLAFAEYQKNDGKNPIEGLKFNFTGMVVPNDTLVWDNVRLGFYKSSDPQNNLYIQVKEVATLENTLPLSLLNAVLKEKPQEITPDELDTHLPQKPPFRFAEKYGELDIGTEKYIIGSMQIGNPKQLNGSILEEFAAQTLSYHKSQEGNTEGFREGTIGTFESSQTHFDDSLISEIEFNSTIYVVGRFKTEAEDREIAEGKKASKKNITNIMEYSLFDSSGICIGFGKLTGTIMKWKLFKRIRGIASK